MLLNIVVYIINSVNFFIIYIFRLFCKYKIVIIFYIQYIELDYKNILNI